MSNGNSAEASTSPSPAPSSIGNNAPKFGTLVPNRVFVGGISGNTTEQDLLELFTKYGKVKATKVINDRAGVSKGYGFVTFETEEEARKLTQEADNIMLKDRKLNIAPAIKKQVNDIGYIKPYSPRLLDGNSTASVLGTNGTVFFGGSGTTYAYTPQMPMLANHSEYHQSVTGVPTPTAAHPTFPQVPQTGAHTAVSAATQQVGGTANAAGYPAQFVYPQMYFPQQYQQYQTAAALQPQWPSSAAAQWRWISPGAFAQPAAAGYITSDGLYTQTAATSLSCETEESCTKGNLSSSNSFYNFPPPCVHSSSSSSSSILACSYCGPPLPSTASGPITSSTTNTTTTTTAIIGSALLKDQFDRCSLQIKPLLPEVSEKVLEQNLKSNDEGSQTTLNGEMNVIPKTLPSRISGNTTMPRRASLLNGRISESSPGSEKATRMTSQSKNTNSPTMKPCPIRKLKIAGQTLPKTKMDSDSFRWSPSPDSLLMNRSSMTPIPAYGIPPPPNNSDTTGELGMWPLPPPITWPTWCPQHSLGGPPMMPVWNGPHHSPLNGLNKKSPGSGSSPHSSHSCGSPNSLPNGCSPTNKAHGEDLLIGKPVFKMDPQILRPPFGMMTPHGSTLMMVPWYQCGPTINPLPWCQWAPYANPYHHAVPVSQFCPTHPMTPTSDTGNSESALTFQFPPKAAPFSSTLQTKAAPSSGAIKLRKSERASDAPCWSMPPTPDTPSYHSPIRSRLPPLLVEPVRCMRRLTQLPDDRCALLPVSPPPMMPLQNRPGNIS